MNLGYACINMELNARKGVDRVTTNRSMIKKTFQEKGLDYASELIIQNVVDLNEIIDALTVYYQTEALKKGN